ncbi:MAG: MotA/TolQ/ExbB proton channel family protein [Campylobacteraceae bacterium]|jgi:biopolymer transport protein ExbB/TolQ|nr:MotA/TolQ/ExbB proton channel family protein [Campylobacteraceae bacterium]
MSNSFFIYLSNSHPVTLFVLGWLSLYFILTFTIFIGRYLYLSSWRKREQDSLEKMLLGAKYPKSSSILSKFTSQNVSASLLLVCKNVAEKNVTVGLSWLSIVASTSPFIGLFGTIVSILETFSKLGQTSSASLGIIAPAISEALVATAGGIFVAIPAYTFHIVLKRSGYDVIAYIQRQIDLMLAESNKYTKEQAINGNRLG